MNNLISICIATFKRPALLEKLLVSLLNQKNIDEYNLEIVVVDNDRNRTAEPVIIKFKEKILTNNRYSIKYDVQPEKNIALTRNKTVELAKGDYLFFIDDDEYADEYCLFNHLKAINDFDSDVTFGNVLPEFESNVSETIQSANPYFKINVKDGLDSKYYITGNALIKLSKLNKNDIFFNPEFGLTGGEDVEMFSRLKKMNFRLLSASSAIAYEHFPSSRSNIKWLIKRAFRTGNDYSRIKITNDDNKLSGAIEFIKGIIQAVLALILAVFFLPFNQSKSFNWLLKAASNIGKPFAVFGYHPKEYK